MDPTMENLPFDYRRVFFAMNRSVSFDLGADMQIQLISAYESREYSMKLPFLLLSVIIAPKLMCAWTAEPSSNDWISVGGDRGCMRFSALKQSDRDNVGKLEVAWRYHTDELKNGVGRTIECTPLVIDGIMYVTTANRRVIALNGATGKEL